MSAGSYRAKRRPTLSRKPFGQTLKALMDAEDITYRALAAKTNFTHAYINMMANGHDTPSEPAMVALAKALRVRPEHFAEYRMLMASRELDFREVGFERALRNLKRWEAQKVDR